MFDVIITFELRFCNHFIAGYVVLPVEWPCLPHCLRGGERLLFKLRIQCFFAYGDVSCGLSGVCLHGRWVWCRLCHGNGLAVRHGILVCKRPCFGGRYVAFHHAKGHVLQTCLLRSQTGNSVSACLSGCWPLSALWLLTPYRRWLYGVIGGETGFRRS